MYESIFNYNFLANFLISLFFLITSILFSIKISLINSVRKLFDFKEYQSIIIFFLIFGIYTFVFSLTILVNHNLISNIFFVIFFSKLLFVINNFKINKILIRDNFDFKKKTIILVFICLYLISILPLSDADSISIYQYLPTKIFIDGLDKIDLSQNIELTLLSNAEILLMISPILKSDNFGSQLNLIVLIYFIITIFKRNNNFSFIMLSSPLIIYFISTQKLQLFFGILFLLTFILIHNNFLKKKGEFFIFIFLLTFYSSAKISYIMFAAPLYLFFCYKNLKNIKYVIFYSIISFLIVYFPLITLKQIYFENIFAPFFDDIFGKSRESFNAFVYSIRSSQGWITEPANYYLYLRPFISFKLSDLSSSLGLIFLLMLSNYGLLKKTKFLPLVLIFLVIATGQILPRYYFEAFLLLAFFYNPKKIIAKIIIYSQVSIIFIISLFYIYISYMKYDVYNNKDKYMNHFSYHFFNSKQYKQYNFNGNILDLGINRHSIYFDENIYSARYLSLLDKFNNRNEENLIKFIQDNSIKYLILDPNRSLPKCLINEVIGRTFRKNSVRNFLLKPIKYELNILKIRNNRCNY